MRHKPTVFQHGESRLSEATFLFAGHLPHGRAAGREKNDSIRRDRGQGAVRKCYDV